MFSNYPAPGWQGKKQKSYYAEILLLFTWKYIKIIFFLFLKIYFLYKHFKKIKKIKKKLKIFKNIFKIKLKVISE
jgi:hypothetical protein